MGRAAHLDDVAHFLFVQTAVSIPVIDFEGPPEFVLQFSAENQMNCCYILQEVYLTILEGTRTEQKVTEITKSTQKSPSFLFSHLVCVKGFKHNLHVSCLFCAGAAVDPKDSLELVEVQIPTGTFTGKPPVELLDVLQTNLRLRSALRLTHNSSQTGWICRSPPEGRRTSVSSDRPRRSAPAGAISSQPVRQIQLTSPNPCMWDIPGLSSLFLW